MTFGHSTSPFDFGLYLFGGIEAGTGIILQSPHLTITGAVTIALVAFAKNGPKWLASMAAARDQRERLRAEEFFASNCRLRAELDRVERGRARAESEADTLRLMLRFPPDRPIEPEDAP